MTAKSRANLKAVFETGDTPTGRDFEDLIDSFLTLTDTTANSIAGNVTVPSLGANTVSAGTVYSDNIFNQGLSTHKNPYVEAYQDVTAITSIQATGAWVQVSGLLTALNAAGFSVSGHDVIYTGAVTAKFLVAGKVETHLSANTNTMFAVMKNAAAVSGTIARYRTASGANAVHQVGFQGVVELKPNDILTLNAQVPNGPIASPEVLGVKYVVYPIYWP